MAYIYKMLIINSMEKETTSMDYQMPSLELLDECIPESKVSDDEIVGKV